MDQLWNNFWVLVWIPPVLWAIVLIIDVFQTNNIFQDRWDGAIISSLFVRRALKTISVEIRPSLLHRIPFAYV